MRVSVVSPLPLPYRDDQVTALQVYAERTNQALERHGTTYVLVDQTGRRVRALPKRRC